MEESLEEKIRYIKILTENVLYKELLNTDKDRNEIIERFIEDLPDYLKSVSNCREIVFSTIAKISNKEKEMDER